MFGLTVRRHVMIAHSLPDEFFGPAQALHGATLVVEATWRRRERDEHGVVMDIGVATGLLDEVLGTIDYRNLDEHPAFAGRFSTSEEVARYVVDELRERTDEAAFAGIDVVVRENPDAWVSYGVDLP